MSLLTRCPACATLFKVVPDQLRISDGWVKCGQCSDIFDASKHLMEVDDLEPPITAPKPPADDSEAIHPTLPAVEPATANETLRTAQNPDSTVTSDVPQLQEVLDGVVAETAASNLPPKKDPPPGDTTDVSQLRWDDDPETENSHQQPPPESEPEDTLPSFLAQDSTRAAWKKPLVRAVLWLAAGLLGLTLWGQWLYAEKDHLAAQYPDMKLTLDQFCTLPYCTIQPLRQIESLSVDSVGFNQLGQETYRLNFVVKNASNLPLLRPAIELTLTDAQDQPAYRRVLSNTELASTSQVINAGAEWSANVVLKVIFESNEQPIRGYRLLIFYP